MIKTLNVGLRLRLPSGSVVRLVRRERTEWACEYVSSTHSRGEVIFSGAWLRAYCTVC